MLFLYTWDKLQARVATTGEQTQATLAVHMILGQVCCQVMHMCWNGPAPAAHLSQAHYDG